MSGEALHKVFREDAVLRLIASRPFAGDVYLVGGAVRELLLSKKPNDYDLALTDRNDMGLLEGLFRRPSFLLGKKPIQAYRIVADDVSLDVTVIEDGIEEDLKRRDFTVNAIAWDVKNRTIIDILGGVEDIEKKIIRYPEEAALINDPLRMLKAVRHFATLQGFVLHEDLVKSMGELKHHMTEAAPERIKNELDQIVVSAGVAEAMRVLDKTGLLFEIFPELFALRQMDLEKNFVLETLGHMLDGFRFFQHYNEYTGLDEKALRTAGYAFLLHDLGKAHTFSYDEEKKVVHFFYHERLSQEIASRIMERLRFSTQEMRAILAIIKNHMRIFLISNNDIREKAVRRLVYAMGELTPSLILHTLCDMYGSSGGLDNPSTAQVKTCCDEIKNAYEESLKAPLPTLVNGNDLIGLGFRPGPFLGQCLNEIRDRQVAGEMTDRDEALEYARTFKR